MMDCGSVGYTAATAVLDASPESVKWEEYMEGMMMTGDVRTRALFIRIRLSPKNNLYMMCYKTSATRVAHHDVCYKSGTILSTETWGCELFA